MTAQFGSTAGSDTNDPVRLPHDGTDYVWLPGTIGNSISKSGDMATTGVSTTDVQFERLSTDTSGSTRWASHFSPAGARFYWDIQAGGYALTLTKDSDGTGFSVPLPFASINVRPCHRLVVDWDHNGANIPRVTGYYADETDGNPTWVSIGSANFPSAVRRPAGVNTFDIGNIGSAFTSRGLLRSFTVRNDGVIVPGLSFNAADAGPDDQLTITSGGDDWTVNRPATGLKTTVVTRPVAVLDGVDDYLQLPASATPSFTATTGKHTVVVAFRKHGVATGSERLYSSESASNNGLYLYVNSATRTVAALVGGTTTTAFRICGSYSDGELTVVAVIVDDGTLRGYGPVGYTATVSTTGVGTITHDPPRIGSRADVVASDSNCEFFAVLDYPGVALTEAELDLIAAKLIAGSYS